MYSNFTEFLATNDSDQSRCDNPMFTFSNTGRVIIATIGIPQSVLTVICNSFVIVTFLTKKDLWIPQHYYFLNLAVCDFLLGSIALPSRLLEDLSGCWPAPFFVCRIYRIIDWICAAETATTVALIARHRYKMVTRGAQFATEETPRYVLEKIALSWLINVSIFGPSQFVDLFTGTRLSANHECVNEFYQIPELGDFLVVAENIIPSLAVITAYIFVFNALQKRRKRIVTLMENTPGQEHSPPKTGIVNEQKRKRTTKQGATMMVLCAVFLIANCPCALISLVLLTCKASCDHTSWYHGYLVSLYVFYGNSLINPIVYTLRIPTMRMMILGCFRTSSRNRNALGRCC